MLALRGGAGLVGELVGLIHEVHGDLTELVSVFAGVVGAEEKLATSLELNAKVGLGAASITAVRSSQRGSSGGNGSCHFGLISLHRCLVQRSDGFQDSPDFVSFLTLHPIM